MRVQEAPILAGPVLKYTGVRQLPESTCANFPCPLTCQHSTNHALWHKTCLVPPGKGLQAAESMGLSRAQSRQRWDPPVCRRHAGGWEERTMCGALVVGRMRKGPLEYFAWSPQNLKLAQDPWRENRSVTKVFMSLKYYRATKHKQNT